MSSHNASAVAHQENLANIARNLLDTRQESRKRGQADWLELLRKMTTVSVHAIQSATHGGGEKGEPRIDPEAAAALAKQDSKIRETIKWVQTNFLTNSNKDTRKQGISLLKDIVIHRNVKYEFTDEVIGSLLKSQLQLVTDTNEEVRVMALDSLKALTMSVKMTVYRHFAEILNKLIDAMPNVSVDHQQSTNKTYGGIIELAKHVLSTIQGQIRGSVHTVSEPAPPEFDVMSFIKVIKRGLGISHNATVCQFVTGHCLGALDWAEDIEVMTYLHHFLGELLHLVAAGSATANVATNTLKELSRKAQAIKVSDRGPDRVECLNVVIRVMAENKHKATQGFGLQWISYLFHGADDAVQCRIVRLIPALIERVVPHCRDAHRGDAATVNDRLCALFRRFGHDAEIDFNQMINFFKQQLTDSVRRLTVLNWLSLLNECRPNVVKEHLAELHESLLLCIEDPNEETLRKSLEVLHIVSNRDCGNWSLFIEPLVDLIPARELLMKKVPVAFKQLQVHAVRDSSFPPDFVLTTVAGFLEKHSNKAYVSTMVMTLSLLLVTAPEFRAVREILRRGAKDESARRTFRALFSCWAFNAVWAVALCLLTREYEEAYYVVEFLAESDVSGHTLVQIDRLLQLLETPVFAFIRLAILKPRENPFLVKALYGLLMILPQTSEQFAALQTRLSAAAQQQAAIGTESQTEKPTPLFQDAFLVAQDLLVSWEKVQRESRR